MTMISIPASSKDDSPKLWPSYGKIICKFIETFLVHGEGDSYGKKFRLRDDQKLLLYQWYEFEANADGSFRRWRYDELYLEFATGWGKTEIGAAMALAELCGPIAPVAPNIPIAAASYEQADLLFGRAKQIIAHENCKLRPFIENGEQGGFDTEILLKGKPGRMFRTAAVAGTNEGGLPSLFMADEIHEWTGGKERVHTVISKSRRKRAGARTINMSTPGHDLDSLAGRMHTVGASGSDPRMLFVTHTADPNLDLKDREQLRTAIRQANPWKTDDQVESLVNDFDKMPEHEFIRYHLCRWVKVPSDGWLVDKPGAWEACAGPAVFTPDDPIVMWWDMSLNRDTTAIGAIQLRSDGRKPVRSRVFDPADYGGRVDYIQVRQHLIDEVKRLNPVSVVYDHRLLEFEAQQLLDLGIPMVDFPQSQERMSPATGLLFDDILNVVIEHNGDPVLAAHVNAAVARQTDRGFSLAKGKSKDPIDACVGLAMADAELSLFEPEEETPMLVTF